MIEFSSDEMNEVFDFVKEYVDWLQPNKYVKITPESVIIEGETDELLSPLVGYEVKFKKDGQHKNDGQLVDYYFFFKSPKGKITEISTEMCLMVGWNHCEDEKIK